MRSLNEKLNYLRTELKSRKIRIMIMGLGSVGNYLLDYLVSDADSEIELFVVGRNREKMISDVNIVRIASLIRGKSKSKIYIISNVDLNDISLIKDCFHKYDPDIIVNTSRAYTGLKYGSISWKNIRAYGIWAPLAIKYIRNIMQAYEQAGSHAIVINTSYSDAVIPWLKSAGRAYPDFGSGNLNHLIPRIQYAAADELDIDDWWNIDVTYAASHFHDVVISKEGQTEGVSQLIDIRYQNQKLETDINKIFKKCKIPMPVDAKRNMMNASSNYYIIHGILTAIKEQKKIKLHCPGVFGEIGGYPVMIDGTGSEMKSYIYEERFQLDDMRKKNRESIYLDGIKDISDGILYYTDELIEKIQKAFGISMVKKVKFSDIENTAQFLITEIIEKQNEQS